MTFAEDMWLRGKAAQASMLQIMAYNTAIAGTATIQAWKLGVTAPMGFWTAMGRAGGVGAAKANANKAPSSATVSNAAATGKSQPARSTSPTRPAPRKAARPAPAATPAPASAPAPASDARVNGTAAAAGAAPTPAVSATTPKTAASQRTAKADAPAAPKAPAKPSPDAAAPKAPAKAAPKAASQGKAAAAAPKAPAAAKASDAPKAAAAPKPADKTPSPHLLDAPRGGKADDLTQLAGVGEKLATSLNEFGIYHFDQIATLDAEGVEWLNEQQPGFKMIAARYKLVDQARTRAGA
jgi:predicted flap endonuclease-1-like 5' DNA nuclease